MDINPQFLKTFITLVELKGFTKTAHKLNMTQPGVSQHIKWLEEYFESSLISRHGKSFELTPQGDQLLQYAKKTFRDHELLKSQIKSDDPLVGKCTFASPGSFGIKMYTFMLKLSKKYKKINIHYYYAPNITIEKQLLDGGIDMGFMSVMPKSLELEATALAKERLLLVVPKNFKFKDFESLLELGFIDHPDGKDMANVLLSANFKKEYRDFSQLKVTGGNNQISRIMEPVAMGLGFTVLPEYACLSFSKQGQVKYLPLKNEISNTIYMVSKKHKVLPKRYGFIVDQFRDSI